MITASDGARAVVHPNGAHVIEWVPAGDTNNRLFLSRKAQYGPGKAIRGGVPVIFPQFSAEGSLPRHGFARRLPWRLLHSAAGEARWALCADSRTLSIWPHRFNAELSVRCVARSIEVALYVINDDGQPFTFTADCIPIARLTT